MNFGILVLTGGMECSKTDQCTFISFKHKNVKERGKDSRKSLAN